MVQFFINISLGLGLGFLWIRFMRPAKDDPRLSRGLQLLQSKIAILEDLSDRTDSQVKHMTLLLEEKAKFVQRQIEAAQEQILQVSNSMQKSHEVAKIFQDKIPHAEIIDRQNTVKYVKAAQMAFQGSTIDEISQAVEIPRSEIEFIMKVNREKLMFNAESLPPWIQYELEKPSSPMIDKAYREAFEPPPTPSSSLSRIGNEFRKAVEEGVVFIEKAEEPVAAAPINIPPIPMTANESVVTRAQEESKLIKAEKAVNAVRAYNFPRVELKK